MKIGKFTALSSDAVDAYIETMLWAETDEEGCPLDKNYDSTDFSWDATKECIDDCGDFIRLLAREGVDWESEMSAGEFGHNFYLTRNRHGVGFWDREYTDQNMGGILTDWAHTYGTHGLYLGDDNQLYPHN